MTADSDPGLAARSSAFIGSVNLVAQVGDKLLSFGQIIVIAAVFGSTTRADTFFPASIVPLTIGFVVGEPIGRAYTTLLVAETDRAAAARLAAGAVALTASALLAVTVLYDFAAVVTVTLATPAGSGDVWPWLAFSAIGPAMGLAGLFSGILIWQHSYVAAAVRVPLASLVGLVLLGLVLSSSHGLVWVGLALAGGYAASAVVLFLRVSATLGRRWALAVTHEGLRAAFEARRLLAGPSVGGAIGGQVIVTIERVLAGTLGAGAVASISYARGLATAPTVFAQAIGASSYPRLVRASADGDTDHQRESFVRGLRLSLLLGAAFVAFLVLFGPDTVFAVFKRGKFQSNTADDVGGALVWFSASTLTGSLIVYLVSVIYGLGRFAAILRLELAIFATYVVAAPIGLVLFGLDGLAAAFGIAQAAGVVAALSICARAVGMSAREVVREAGLQVLPLAIAAVALLAVYRLAIDNARIPNGLVGDVRVGGAAVCLAVGCTAILLASSLPEAAQLRRFLFRPRRAR